MPGPIVLAASIDLRAGRPKLKTRGGAREMQGRRPGCVGAAAGADQRSSDSASPPQPRRAAHAPPPLIRAQGQLLQDWSLAATAESGCET